MPLSPPLKRSLFTLSVFIFATSTLIPAVQAEPPADALLEECRNRCADLPCEEFDFQGFSPDGKQAGYRRLLCPGDHSEEKRREGWHLVRLVRNGARLETHQSPVKGRFPQWFKQQGFEFTTLQGTVTDKARWSFSDPWGRTYEVRLETREKVYWHLDVLLGDAQLLTYESPFNEIYFDVRPQLYLTPKGDRLAVVLSLDALIRRDAGMVFLVIPWKK